MADINAVLNLSVFLPAPHFFSEESVGVEEFFEMLVSRIAMISQRFSHRCPQVFLNMNCLFTNSMQSYEPPYLA